jgi:hypothetical protein
MGLAAAKSQKGDCEGTGDIIDENAWEKSRNPKKLKI